VKKTNGWHILRLCSQRSGNLSGGARSSEGDAGSEENICACRREAHGVERIAACSQYPASSPPLSSSFFPFLPHPSA